MKFRRKSNEPAPVDEPVDETLTGDSSGPWDVDDLSDDSDVERLDLGSLLIEAEPGRELRLQVDESTGEVQAVMLAGADGAVELRAFAAPRNGDLWSTIRPQIAAEMAQLGGTASEREGRFGTELVCQLPVQREDGSAATQPSRIIGVNGPRWMLRATLLGRPAMEVEGSQAWEDTIAKVVVRRGEGAMPVGDALPVVLPADARRVEPPTA